VPVAPLEVDSFETPKDETDAAESSPASIRRVIFVLIMVGLLISFYRSSTEPNGAQGSLSKQV
jgi:hypothetical protein